MKESFGEKIGKVKDKLSRVVYNAVNPKEQLPPGWTPRDIPIASKFAIEQALDTRDKKIEELKDLSGKDPLTGLSNRREFDARMEAIMKRRGSKPPVLERKRGDDPRHVPDNIEKRKPRHVAIIYFDLDHFKQLNDEYGHDAGDLVLKKVGELLTSGEIINREGEFGSRYGGEEFVVVLPETSGTAGGVKVADKIRKAIETLNLTYGGKPIPVHASFGVASTETADNLEKIIIQADTALKKAKKSGRNKVVYCEERSEWPTGDESNIV